MTKSIKKMLAIFVCVIMLFACLPFNVFAGDRLDIRGVDVSLPDVTAEIEGSVSSDDISSMKLDGEELKIKDTKDGADGSRVVYLLVDISTSMSQSALDALKPSLISYAKSLGKDDKLVMMTFGEDINTVLKGGESGSQIESAINNIRCDSLGTTFYKVLTKALDNSVKHTAYDRRFAIVVSDGADFEKGNSSQEEVVDKLKTNRMPVYGMCLDSTETSSANGFGYISRESGGELVKFSNMDAKSKFDSLKKQIDDVTIITAKSKNKKSNGIKDLEINLKDNKYAEDTVKVNAKADSSNPVAETIEYNKETNSIEVTFSERVDQADKASSYIVKKNDKELAVVSVKYNDKTHVATINMDKRVYSGKYDISFVNITDTSDNQNPMDKETYEDIELQATPIIVKILIIVGIVMIPILFLLAIYIILLSIKKKKNVATIKDIFVEQVEEKQFEQIHIEPKKGKPVRFAIDAGNGQYYDINYNLVGSVIIGRGSICDVSIDDVNMSRQHFVLEDVGNGLAVTDLQTTNGTYVNGVLIQSRTFVDSESKISAGNSTITVIY